MAQPQPIHGNRNHTRIDVHQIVELRNWARKLGVTPQDVKAAVGAVGSNGEAVARHLQSWYTVEHPKPDGLPSRAPAKGLGSILH